MIRTTKNLSIFLISFCCITLTAYLYFYSNNKESGSGTFDDPYCIEDNQKIEESFNKYYNSNLLKPTDIPFEESTSCKWVNSDTNNNDIIIDNIQYFGKERIADLMIIISRNQISKDLSKFLDNNFSNNEKMVTSSLYNMQFKFVNKKHNKTNKTKFVLRLTDEVLNDSKMMIISYRIKIDNDWYKGYTMIIDDSMNYINIPDVKYGKGDIKKI